MILIKIDRNSIKRNPRAYATSTVISGLKRIRFVTSNEIPNSLTENKDYIITSVSIIERAIGQNDGSLALAGRYKQEKKIEGLLINPEKILLLKSVNGTIVEVQHEYETIHHFPLPEWDYRYELKRIECNKCHKHFSISELSEDYDDDGYRNYYCPKCYAPFDYEDVEMEDIDQVVKEMNL